MEFALYFSPSEGFYFATVFGPPFAHISEEEASSIIYEYDLVESDIQYSDDSPFEKLTVRYF